MVALRRLAVQAPGFRFHVGFKLDRLVAGWRFYGSMRPSLHTFARLHVRNVKDPCLHELAER